MPLEYHFKASAGKVYAKLTDARYLEQRCLGLTADGARAELEHLARAL